MRRSFFSLASRGLVVVTNVDGLGKPYSVLFVGGRQASIEYFKGEVEHHVYKVLGDFAEYTVQGGLN